MPSSGGSSQPRNQTQVSHTAGRFFTVWATREATGGGNLSLLQGMFLTKELNQGLLHSRRILNQLSYQGRPRGCIQQLLIKEGRGCGDREEQSKNNSADLGQVLVPPEGIHIIASLISSREIKLPPNGRY